MNILSEKVRGKKEREADVNKSIKHMHGLGDWTEAPYDPVDEESK